MIQYSLLDENDTIGTNLNRQNDELSTLEIIGGLVFFIVAFLLYAKFSKKIMRK